MKQIEIPVKYQPLFRWLTYIKGEHEKPPFSVAILTGGRNSFKSYTASVAFAEAVSNYNHRILYTRYTMSSAKDSIIPEFTNKLELLNYGRLFDVNTDRIVKKVMEGEKETDVTPKVVFKGIKTSSGNQTASLKSLSGFSIFVLEEAEEMPTFEEWDKIRKSIRATDVNNLCVLILNPTTKEHWVHKKFFEEAGVPDGWNGIKDGVCYIHTTFADGKAEWMADHILEDFLRYKNYYDEYLATPEKDRDTLPDKVKSGYKYYKHTVLGGWLDKAEGVIFTNWSIGEFFDNGQTIFGQDYGFSNDPTTLVEVSVLKSQKKIYLRERLYKTGMKTSEIAGVNRSFAGESLIVGDSAEPRLIDELKDNFHLNIVGTIKGAGSVSAGIALMQDYELIIDPNSINLIKELNNYVWNDKKSKTPVDAFNHLLDAVRYAVAYYLTAEPEEFFF